MQWTKQGQRIARLLVRTPIIRPASAPDSNPPATKTGQNAKVKKQNRNYVKLKKLCVIIQLASGPHSAVSDTKHKAQQ